MDLMIMMMLNADAQEAVMLLYVNGHVGDEGLAVWQSLNLWWRWKLGRCWFPNTIILQWTWSRDVRLSVSKSRLKLFVFAARVIEPFKDPFHFSLPFLDISHWIFGLKKSPRRIMKLYCDDSGMMMQLWWVLWVWLVRIRIKLTDLPRPN